MLKEPHARLKETLVGARVGPDLLKKLDKVMDLTGLNRSLVVRAALEKLIRDNNALIDYHEIADYYCFIARELDKLPHLVTLNDASWTSVKNSTMSHLCAEFWRTSRTVFSFWKELVEKDDALSDAFREYLADDTNSERWKTHVHFLLEADPTQDAGDLFEGRSWLDSSAALKVTFAYASKKAIEECGAERIVKELLETEEHVKKKKLSKLVINARGGPRLRAPVEGKNDLSAVYTEGAEQ